MTELPKHGVPEDVYDEVVTEHGEQGASRIIMAITTINAWNRIGVSTGMQPALSSANVR
jgi:alkylhydroperoxidase family enzyme